MEWVPLDPSLGESCAELWNRSLGARFPMRLQQGLWEEPNFDEEASRAVIDDGRVIALTP